MADFIERHLGREVFERIVEPLFAGIYAGDARQLSLPAMYPQLLVLEKEYGSKLRSLLVMRRVEDRPLLACTWTSNKFPHRARRGYALFRCFLGSAGRGFT